MDGLDFHTKQAVVTKDDDEAERLLLGITDTEFHEVLVIFAINEGNMPDEIASHCILVWSGPVNSMTFYLSQVSSIIPA